MNNKEAKEKETQQKRPIYSKSEVKSDTGKSYAAIAFGKRDLINEPTPKGVIPQTGATKDTMVYGKFNEAINRPFEGLKELLEAE